MIFIGIDIGLKGGLCALSDVAGVAPIALLPMPVTDVLDGSGKWVEEIDVRAVLDWFVALQTPPSRLRVAIEEAAFFSPGPCAVRSLAYNYGMIVGMLRTKGIRPTPVPPGNSKKGWQTPMLGPVPKGETKAYALAKAKELWPDEDFIPVGCRKPHDGIIDAALIAEFHRRKGV